MPNRYILFQAYGNKGVLLECKLALLQLLKHNDTSSFCVLLYTDNLDFYKEIFQQFNHFSIQPLTKEKITQWRGDIEFAHRVKIEMLLHFFETHTGAVVYFDTDTYCRSSIIPMFEAIEKGSIFMHTYEGNLDNRKSIIFKKWRRFLENNKTILNEKAQK